MSGPARGALVDRDWPAWGGLWALGGSAVLWAAAASAARDWFAEGGRAEAGYHDASRAVSYAALGLGVVLPLLFVVAAVTWRRWPRVTRGALAVGGLGLLVAAWAWSGVPDAGPLYVAASAVGGLLALFGAMRGPGEGASSRGPWVRRSAALALAVAGVVLGWICLQALAYWQWSVRSGDSTLLYAVGVGVGALLVVLALAARVLPRGPRWLGVTLGVVLALFAGALLVGSWEWLTTTGLLHYHPETESALAYGTPMAAAATGLLAAGCAAAARRWPLAAWSVAAGLLLTLAALARESTISHLI